jgi:hypothetical protein
MTVEFSLAFEITGGFFEMCWNSFAICDVWIVRVCVLAVCVFSNQHFFLLIESTTGCQNFGLPITEGLGGKSKSTHPYPV